MGDCVILKQCAILLDYIYNILKNFLFCVIKRPGLNKNYHI